MSRLTRVIASIVGAGMLLLGQGQVAAQVGSALDLSAEYQFGESVTFIARLGSPAIVQSASIFILDTTQNIAYSNPVVFDANGESIFRFDTKQSVLRPFTTLLWHYELTFADGSSLQSDARSIRYDDNRFKWHTQEANALRVHWYEGDESFGLAALNAGLAGLDNIGNFFVPDLSQPVDVYVYASDNDLRGSLFDAEDWVAGHADSPAGVVMVTIPPGTGQGILMDQRIPHELMHVLMYRNIGAGYARVPAWLREGAALLAESYPNPDFDRILKDAYGRDQMIPIVDLCASFSPKIDSAFLAYAESRSFSNYLRGRYGADGLLSLAKIYAGGVECEHGTDRAFGVSLAKLERDWQTDTFGKPGLTDTLQRFAPYIGLLCLVLLVPLAGMVASLRKAKGAG